MFNFIHSLNLYPVKNTSLRSIKKNQLDRYHTITYHNDHYDYVITYNYRYKYVMVDNYLSGLLRQCVSRYNQRIYNKK